MPLALPAEQPIIQISVPLYERVAAIEPQLRDVKKEVEEVVIEFRIFKETMIKEIADLAANVKNISWRVSMITGGVVVILQQLTSWGFKKFLP